MAIDGVTAYIGSDFKLQMLMTNVSPNAYQDIGNAFNFGEVGEQRPQVDITVYTDTARAYRGGLPDGLDLNIEMNFTGTDLKRDALFTHYTNSTKPSFKVVSQSASPTRSFIFTAAVLGWRVSGVPGEKSVVTFNCKISGSITRA
jgi:hypothetical protein